MANFTGVGLLDYANNNGGFLDTPSVMDKGRVPEDQKRYFELAGLLGSLPVPSLGTMKAAPMLGYVSINTLGKLRQMLTGEVSPGLIKGGFQPSQTQEAELLKHYPSMKIGNGIKIDGSHIKESRKLNKKFGRFSDDQIVDWTKAVGSDTSVVRKADDGTIYLEKMYQDQMRGTTYPLEMPIMVDSFGNPTALSVIPRGLLAD